MNKSLLFLLFIGMTHFSFARPPKGSKKHSPKVTYRTDCQPGTSQIDLDINNVRAGLLSRGDMWWNYNNAVYEVPKGSGLSTIGAGAIWMGGYDAFGNLKLAAMTYAESDKTDYYPGPLDMNGTTDGAICSLWNRHFVVYGAEIDELRAAWALAQQNGTILTDDQIPDNIKAYPARGNPYYVNGFDLPDQVLAPFYDRNEDEIFDPLDGDFPAFERHGVSGPKYADKMIFQIFNDNGGMHTNTFAQALRMEIHLMSFAFQTDNNQYDLDNVTFSDYKFIYRGQETISDMYFSLWVDGDIGCGEDDFVGIDTTHELVYFYNSSDVDGSCANSYGTQIPIQGISLVRGPLDSFGSDIGLTSFIYYNNSDSGMPEATTDPEVAADFYSYMSGHWKDGSPLYAGKDGYKQSLYPTTKYAFHSSPDNSNGWSMAQEALDGRDIRAVLSSGPIEFEAGRTKQLIYSLSTVLDVKHPNPKINKLIKVDSMAREYVFSNICFPVNTSLIGEDNLLLFPNPTSDYFQIKSPNSSRVNLQLVNMSGQVMLSQKVKTNTDISVSHLPQGIYGYQVWDDQGQRMGSGKVTISR